MTVDKARNVVAKWERMGAGRMDKRVVKALKVIRREDQRAQKEFERGDF